ncbi:ribosomal protein S27AE [Pedobacter sp. CG_S7]|uniref:topoisomerase C-terminal repeat-containing protein n=1 Tax=Pedobacter sp. CG_S7 TaxID=3143930 RepID=UPI003396722A
MNRILNCPVCNQGELIEGANAYLCNHFKSMVDKCSFRIFKTYFGKNMTDDIVKHLCDHGTTVFFYDLVNKDSKPFGAKLTIVDGYIKPHFDNQKQLKLQSGCPKCGKGVFVTNKAFVCEDYFNDKACDLYIGKKIAEVELSNDNAETLLNGNLTDYRTDFISNSSKEFGAKLSLGDDYHLKFDFEILKCPKCKTGSVSSNNKAYGCSNYRDENIKCDFTIWREVSGNKIMLNDLIDLCNGKKTGIKLFKPKDADQYKGQFQLNNEYKLEIVNIW